MVQEGHNIFDQTCRDLLTTFFVRFPNEQLQLAANSALERLIAKNAALSGKPASWAARLVPVFPAS